MTNQSAAVDPASETNAWYPKYVLGVLFLAYVTNIMDRGVLSALLESIKKEFTLSDTQLGLLTGIAFAFFFATFGIPIAALADRWKRTRVLAISITLWSGMTALCGAASSFGMLLATRIGTAIGEGGGTPSSHSLISDYFRLKNRATALSVYALGVPIGQMLGSMLGGWGNDTFGWRIAFALVGVPGLLIAALVFFTVREPQRGMSDAMSRAAAAIPAPPMLDVVLYMWRCVSFRHMSLACALHAFVWYGGSQLNNSYLQRSHDMTASEAGYWIGIMSLIGAAGSFLGGYLSDKLSNRYDDRRWYMWLPGICTLIMVPFQFVAYLSGNVTAVIGSLAIMVLFGSVFFGPSFAMTQALATLRMRSIASSILLFIQTLIGLGLGPLFAGMISDYLRPTVGVDSLGYGLAIVGLVNIWAAGHYFYGARSLRRDLEATEALMKAV